MDTGAIGRPHHAPQLPAGKPQAAPMTDGPTDPIRHPPEAATELWFDSRMDSGQNDPDAGNGQDSAAWFIAIKRPDKMAITRLFI